MSFMKKQHAIINTSKEEFMRAKYNKLMQDKIEALENKIEALEKRINSLDDNYKRQ